MKKITTLTLMAGLVFLFASSVQAKKMQPHSKSFKYGCVGISYDRDASDNVVIKTSYHGKDVQTHKLSKSNPTAEVSGHKVNNQTLDYKFSYTQNPANKFLTLDHLKTKCPYQKKDLVVADKYVDTW